MKKILFIYLVVTCLFASCKKNSPASNSLTASMNGTNKTFATAALAVKVVRGGLTTIAIGGAVNVGTGEVLNIGIDNSLSGDSIVAGTYSDTSTAFSLSLAYNSPNSLGGYQGGTSVDGSEYFGSVPVSNHVKLVITSIDNSSIKGTFSGNIYLNRDLTNTPYPITNGNFSMKLALR